FVLVLDSDIARLLGIGVHGRSLALPQPPVRVHALLIELYNPCRCELAVPACDIGDVMLRPDDAPVICAPYVVAVVCAGWPRSRQLISKLHEDNFEMGEIPEPTIQVN